MTLIAGAASSEGRWDTVTICISLAAEHPMVRAEADHDRGEDKNEGEDLLSHVLLAGRGGSVIQTDFPPG
jgi:hypothetical protein